MKILITEVSAFIDLNFSNFLLEKANYQSTDIYKIK